MKVVKADPEVAIYCEQELMDAVVGKDNHIKAYAHILNKFGVVGFIGRDEFNRFARFLENGDLDGPVNWSVTKMLMWTDTIGTTLHNQFGKARVVQLR